MSWLFKEAEHSQLYLKYRPNYPANVYKLLVNKLKESFGQLPEDQKHDWKIQVNGKWRLAIDVGCGPGTSTFPLADYFQKVIGVDCSESQINEAIKAYGNRDPSKVSFVCQDACNLSSLVEKSNVDLVTTALALHWFDQKPKFYAECKKILRPGGLLVAYGYAMNTFEDKRDQDIFDEFYGTINSCGEQATFDTEDCYARLFVEFKEHFPSAERDDSLSVEFDISVEDYVRYLSTWAIYKKYRTMNPDKEDPLKIAYENGGREENSSPHPPDMPLLNEVTFFIQPFGSNLGSRKYTRLLLSGMKLFT